MLLQRTDGIADDWGPATAPPPPARYGSDARPRMAAIGATVAIHGVLLLGLLGLSIRATHQDNARIVAVNLTPASKAEPPASEQPAEPAPAERTLSTAVHEPAVPAPMIPPAIALAPPVAQAAAVPLAAPAALEPAAPAPAPAATTASTPSVRSGDLGTRILSAPPPRYPVQSRRRREQGTVELLLTLAVDGTVESIAVSRSSGFPRLDDAALGAVRRWRWEPTLQAGAPVKVRGIVAIPFVLADRA